MDDHTGVVECCVCLEATFQACALACGHRNHCAHCLLRLVTLSRRSETSGDGVPRCPSCRAPFRVEDIDIDGLRAALVAKNVPAAHLAAVESALDDLWAPSRPPPPLRRLALSVALVFALLSSAARFVFPKEAMAATVLARSRALDSGLAHHGWRDEALPSYRRQTPHGRTSVTASAAHRTL